MKYFLDNAYSFKEFSEDGKFNLGLFFARRKDCVEYVKERKKWFKSMGIKNKCYGFKICFSGGFLEEERVI